MLTEYQAWKVMAKAEDYELDCGLCCWVDGFYETGEISAKTHDDMMDKLEKENPFPGRRIYFWDRDLFGHAKRRAFAYRMMEEC